VTVEHEGGELAGSDLPVSLSIMICLSSG
jgi:hypothetical protein